MNARFIGQVNKNVVIVRKIMD